MMRIPTVYGVIERRILVNYRVRRDVLARVLPAPFEPKVVADDWGMVGICLIRLKEIRPRFWPARWGIWSENAAHRMAVQWRVGDEWREGVYIPRRDTSSWLNHWAGGRIFPGVHYRAEFGVEEVDGRYDVGLVSEDGETRMRVVGEVVDAWPRGSLFETVAEASAFFEAGSLGYSATKKAGCFDGLTLHTEAWAVAPMRVLEVSSSYFEDRERFPEGAIEFDCALLMEDIPHEWRGEEMLKRDLINDDELLTGARTLRERTADYQIDDGTLTEAKNEGRL
ncbi:MAG TPA: DUF2071 domain-containing protein [Anaerolineae bacterium]|nr:DUF2071 domain-containing protein [Anaerolineae bacterium]